jgi:transcriptional regulator with XRE-family HTH domain
LRTSSNPEKRPAHVMTKSLPPSARVKPGSCPAPANDSGIETIGQRLYRIRAGLKASSADFAARLTVSEASYTCWERGETEPPLMLFHWIRDAFGPRVARDLIADDREPPTPSDSTTFNLTDIRAVDARIHEMAAAEGLPMLGAHAFALARMVQDPLYDRESRLRLIALGLRIGAACHNLKLFPPQPKSPLGAMFG